MDDLTEGLHRGSLSKFPKNPDDFNPKGLSKKTFETKNGKVTKWFDFNKRAIYEWDEDTAHGSHYHVIGERENRRIPNSTGDTHFKFRINLASATCFLF